MRFSEAWKALEKSLPLEVAPVMKLPLRAA
jgi:hypothetical protein